MPQAEMEGQRLRVRYCPRLMATGRVGEGAAGDWDDFLRLFITGRIAASRPTMGVPEANIRAWASCQPALTTVKRRRAQDEVRHLLLRQWGLQAGAERAAVLEGRCSPTRLGG